MGDLISRSALLEEMKRKCERNCKRCDYSTFLSSDEHCGLVDEAPTVEAVPVSYVNQIRWEHDIAVEQLNEIGCQLGQKMDDVKKKLEAEPVVQRWMGRGEVNENVRGDQKKN